MRSEAMRGENIGFAAFCAVLIGVVVVAHQFGMIPLLAFATIVGPLALALLCVVRWPTATLLGAFALLAPADALLAFGNGTTLARFAAIAACLGLGIAIVCDRTSRALPRFVAMWFAVLAWMIATLFWASDQTLAINGFEQIGLSMLVFVLAALVRARRTDLRVIIGAMVTTSIAVSAYAIVIHPVVANLGARVVLKNANGRDDPNDLAAALIPVFCLMLASAAAHDRRTWRVAALLATPLVGYAIVVTESRGGLIAAGAAILWTLIRSRHRVGALVTGAFVGAIGFMQTFGRFANDSTGSGRTDIWRIGLAAFREHWLFGSGIGTFPDAYNAAYLAVPHHFYVGWSRPAHDLLVQSFTELGIIGGTLVLGAWWFQFRALAVVGRSDRDYWLRIAAEAATLSGFIAALFIDVLDIKQTWIIPMLIALILSVRASESASGPA